MCQSPCHPAAAIAALALAPALNAEIIVPTDLPLGAALALADHGETITLLPGVYDGSQELMLVDKAVVLRSASGDPTDTIIDGFGVSRILSISGASSGGTVLRGITFRNGASNTAGAALRLTGADVTIDGCAFEDNVMSGADAGGAVRGDLGHITVLGTVFRNNVSSGAGSDGGAFFFQGTQSSHLVRGCTFVGNSAVNTGGAFRVDSSTCQVTSCLFEGNSADGDTDIRGGAVFFRGGADITIDGCTFRENHSGDHGGALATLDAGTGVTIRNSVFQRNSSNFDGGAINSNAQCTIVNCTFEGNTSANCAVLCGSSGSVVTIDNSILWNNDPGADLFHGGSISVAYSIVEGGAAGLGNLDVDPGFVAAGNDDLGLQAGSPAIDAGSSSRYFGPFVDHAGLDRATDDPAAQDSGETVAGPIVDIGAFERQTDGPVPSCPGDVNGDGSVDVLDLIQLVLNWGICP